jgi:hypothetical protein
VYKAILDYLRLFLANKIGPDKVAKQKGKSAFVMPGLAVRNA